MGPTATHPSAGALGIYGLHGSLFWCLPESEGLTLIDSNLRGFINETNPVGRQGWPLLLRVSHFPFLEMMVTFVSPITRTEHKLCQNRNSEGPAVMILPTVVENPAPPYSHKGRFIISHGKKSRSQCPCNLGSTSLLSVNTLGCSGFNTSPAAPLSNLHLATF